MRLGLMISAAFAVAACRPRPMPMPDPVEPPPPTPVTDRTKAPQTALMPSEPAGLVDILPHVRVDRAQRIVEFDGFVPIDCHDPRTPDVWLEQMVCIPDTKEHESLVVSEARPSDVHAALLLIGLAPGKPGSYHWDGWRIIPVPPEGDPVALEFVYNDPSGAEIAASPCAWVIDAWRERTLAEELGEGPAFVFAGSRFVSYNGPEVYDADYAGTFIGLATFGGETIALREVISHEAAYQEPEWLANSERVPPYGTPVRVRIRPWEPG